MVLLSSSASSSSKPPLQYLHLFRARPEHRNFLQKPFRRCFHTKKYRRESPIRRALKFYSSQRLDIRRIETLKEGTEAVGNRVRVKVVKNKVAAPFRQAEFDIEFGRGISTSGCILDLGIEHGIVTKSGSFFSYGEDRLGQGRNNAKAFLDEHVEIAKEIEAKIYEALAIDRDLVVADRARRGSRGHAGPRRPDHGRGRFV